MKKIVMIWMFGFLFFSCSKEFLEKKSDQKLLIPNTLEDFQLLLDNNGVMNRTPGLGLIASDDFYITETGFDNLDEINQRAYTWELNRDLGLTNSDWRVPYEQIFYSNIVLDGLIKLGMANNEGAEIKGQALFFRAYALFGLLQEFAPPYRRERASQQDAVPVPLGMDITSDRPIKKVAEVYDQILQDLILAEQLLPRTQAIKTRPSAVAALSLLGRVCLLMENYLEAETYLERVYLEYSRLIDYNTLVPTASRPFPTDFPTGPGNDEIIFYSPFINYSFLGYTNTQVRVEKRTVDLYAPDDLRRGLYFQDRGDDIYTFKGSYSGSRISTLFAGLSTDENYLNYAEVLVRNGKNERAEQILDELLETRYTTETYPGIQREDDMNLLDVVLLERQKSLIGKGARWWDIRRFNHDEQNMIKVVKSVKGVDYELELNDERLQFSFPMDESVGN